MNGNLELRSDAVETIKGGGVAAILVSYFANFTIPDWAALLAAVYSVMLIAEKVHKWWVAWRLRRNKPE